MSRADSIGLFWEDDSKQRSKLRRSPEFWGIMPMIPETGWRPPSDFPNLSAAKVISFDTETWDPELNEAGPGWGRGKGHIIGASIAVEDGTSWYFPMRHGIVNGKQMLSPEHAAMNMDPEAVLRYLDHVLHDNRPKVGANLIYDVGWLNWEGVRVGGKLSDIQFAEALLDSEAPNVGLDELAYKYLGIGKETEDLYEWLACWNRKKAGSAQREWLYATPPVLAGPYAEADAALPLKVIEKQWSAMHTRGVLDLFDLECRLIPLLVKMRMKGAPVSVTRAEKVYDDLSKRLEDVEGRLTAVAGRAVNPGSPKSMEDAFRALGIPIPKKVSKVTGLEAVSFDKKILSGIDHPFVNIVTEHRELLKVRDTFIKSYIIEKNIKGRIHCEFHPLKSEGSGTRSGRFASRSPNLQNIPVRTAEGKLVREAFDGTLYGLRWRSYDYSSIEYRLLANYAVGVGAEEVRAIYAKDPTADYHKIVGDLIAKLTGLVLERGKVKTINFGIIYGMALNALATALGLTKPAAKKLLDDYHAAAPYARATMDMCANEVHTTGMVRTVLNRASDFNAWGAKDWQEEGRKSYPYAVACQKYGRYNIERQHTHKALNRKLQGSAADVMKKAMVDAYEAGLFEEHACGIPILTVHDELDFEDKGDLDNPAWEELKHVMEHCMDHLLRVPLLVDGGYGETWADAH